MIVCKNCLAEFNITDSDGEFYKKIGVPPPTCCPQCRLQRRLTFRNERTLYQRTCDFCKKRIITIYDPEHADFTVYCQDCWWSDKWDPLEYGVNFDFSRGFFEQYAELQARVPRLALMNRNAENSEYCNYAGYNKNSYLAVGGSWYNEDCLYGRRFSHCQSSLDCDSISKSELCYEAVWGSNLYHCIYVFDSFNSHDCFFSFNLRSCDHCLFCANLRGEQYRVWNKPVSKEEFERLTARIGNYQTWLTMQEDFAKLHAENPPPAYRHINCENCSGDYLENCKNVRVSYTVFDSEDCKYIVQAENIKDMMDCSSTGYDHPQLFYEMANAGNGGFHNVFSFNIWNSSEIAYCDTVMNSMDNFACVNMNRKRYCILNKQYSQESFASLRMPIVEHMKKTGEFGEFFPIRLSPFAYNETVAQDYFPLTKDEALRKGYRWKESASRTVQSQTYQIPDDIRDVKDDIVDAILVCADCGKNYRMSLLKNSACGSDWKYGEKTVLLNL